MSDIELRAASWDQFIPTGLTITPELLGLYHEFEYQQHPIRIELPQTISPDHDPTREPLATIFSWREVDGVKVPVHLSVDSVNVIVIVSEDVTIPEKALQVPLNAYDVISEAQQKQLNNVASKYRTVAEEAFDLWIRTLRWKAGSSFIGRPEVRGAASGWSTYLINLASEERFWATPRVLTVRRIAYVDILIWEHVQLALQSGQEPPIFYDLMFDAIEHMELGDLKRAVVDLAVACESYMRNLVLDQLPPNVGGSIKRYIDEANIRQYINHFVPDVLSEDELRKFKKINSDLHKLFSARNDILHSGTKDDLTREECQKYVETTRKLIAVRQN